MSIAEKLDNLYKNHVILIKKEKNRKIKTKLIVTLLLDLKEYSIRAVARVLNCSRKFIKKCSQIANYGFQLQLQMEFRGRKKKIQEFPNLPKQLEKIVEDHLITDSQFKTEKQYVRLTLKEIKQQLITKNGYKEKDISKSTLANILNEMGYNLKKVQKTKPLKKIEETNAIFDNVHKKKEEAMNSKTTALISLDTKDKVLLGPFSRKGKNRIEIKAVDHELTNNCLIPFGILDLKTNIPYFFNFTKKPTSLDLVDSIDEFWQENYANSKCNKLSILLDNGPDNSGVRTIFLKGLIEVCKRHNIQIELIYYPPYHSKYNPVERLWARLENIWNGFLLETKEICLKFMKNLTWKNNLSVTKLKTVKYEKGLTVNKKEMKELEEKHIIRNKDLKKWSILINP